MNRGSVVPDRVWAEPSECAEDMLGESGSSEWLAFAGGALCGFVAGLLAVAIPAILIAWVIQ